MGELDVVNWNLETIKKCLSATSIQQSGTVGSGCEPIFFSLLLILESIQISSVIVGCGSLSVWTLSWENMWARLKDLRKSRAGESGKGRRKMLPAAASLAVASLLQGRLGSRGDPGWGRGPELLQAGWPGQSRLLLSCFLLGQLLLCSPPSSPVSLAHACLSPPPSLLIPPFDTCAEGSPTARRTRGPPES